MPVNYQEVRKKIGEYGQTARERNERLSELRGQALRTLAAFSADIVDLKAKVEAASRSNPNLRSAKPAEEPLTFTGPRPPAPAPACLLAADGSQVTPSRHDPVEFGLVNIGTVTMPAGGVGTPGETTTTDLLLGDALYTNNGLINEQYIASQRDLGERVRLADLAEQELAGVRPLFTLTDGPLELWFGDRAETAIPARTLEAYLEALLRLQRAGVCTAGYIDGPASDLVLRLLEIAELPGDQLSEAGRQRKYQGLRDRDLFRDLLQPGERSAVFALQSRPTEKYSGPAALHFFYLNVGRAEKPWLARVEIPRWVVDTPGMLDHLHALLLQECARLGTRPYPYVLHRAHEVAVVTLEEKKQLGLLISQAAGSFEGGTNKQTAKDLPGRTRLARPAGARKAR